jgi:hypothetical protein
MYDLYFMPVAASLSARLQAAAFQDLLHPGNVFYGNIPKKRTPTELVRARIDDNAYGAAKRPT